MVKKLQVFILFYLFYIFVNNFLCVNFLQLFQEFWNQHKILRFFIYFFIFLKNYFFRVL